MCTLHSITPCHRCLSQRLEPSSDGVPLFSDQGPLDWLPEEDWTASCARALRGEPGPFKVASKGSSNEGPGASSNAQDAGVHHARPLPQAPAVPGTLVGLDNAEEDVDRVVAAACGAMTGQQDEVVSRVNSDDEGSESSLEGFDLQDALDHAAGASSFAPVVVSVLDTCCVPGTLRTHMMMEM